MRGAKKLGATSSEATIKNMNIKNMNIGVCGREILIITGLSGSGKSSVLRSLEDLGFYCVDNLPVPLLSPFVNFVFKGPSPMFKVALGIDARGGEFLSQFMTEINKLKSVVKIVFLTAQDSTILKRFQETRRSHPLTRSLSRGLSKDLSLSGAIKKEREILSPIESLADEIHYTDHYNPHELRGWVSKMFAAGFVRELSVNLISFGFKYGVPAESNLVYDLSFLPNPFFVDHLRFLDGRDKRVSKYLFDKREVCDYWDRLRGFLKYLLRCYCDEGRFFANVSIGCTGGKHRSVAFVEKLFEESWDNIKFIKYHRDLGKE